jgi:deazaflavin-dependent oxidoreductase (nitroreductase family)
VTDPFAAPLPRLAVIKPFTTRVFNPLVRPFIHRLPGFAIVNHEGRRSGRTFRTPMNVFRVGDDYVFALTYGANVDWVRNVLAAGGAELQMGSARRRVTSPELFVDEKAQLVPLPVRLVLRLLRVTVFLRMRPAG